MSVSKWAYRPDKCEGDFCIGECDLCYKAKCFDDDEIEDDGFVTREEDLNGLERTGEDKARLITECLYPKCERCHKYVASMCTVPMVITKQQWLDYCDWVVKVDNRIDSLEDLILFKEYTNEVLGVQDAGSNR